MALKKKIEFFLGANTPTGFVSFFDELKKYEENWINYIIKGGAGTGKSTTMKKISNSIEDENEIIEDIRCSSDPDSLDAVILHNKQLTICDGTPPHTMEPKYPGAYEKIVNFCECFDNEKLFAKREEIKNISTEITNCHKRCCRYLAAVNDLTSNIYLSHLETVNPIKIGLTAKRVISKECKRRKQTKQGKEHKRLLSAFTPKGVVCFKDTLITLCNKFYILKDNYGACSNLFLIAIRSLLLELGYEIYTCYCPLNPHSKIEHIMVPELGLGFVTTNKYFEFDHPNSKNISYARFTDLPKLKNKKQLINFNQKAIKQLIEEAVDSLKTAKQLHDDLEKYYIEAVDFKQIDEIAKNLLKDFCGK